MFLTVRDSGQNVTCSLISNEAACNLTTGCIYDEYAAVCHTIGLHSHRQICLVFYTQCRRGCAVHEL